MKKTIKFLESVGTAIDLQTLKCYPMVTDGTIDTEAETDLFNGDEQEWKDLLSKEDYNLLYGIQYEIEGEARSLADFIRAEMEGNPLTEDEICAILELEVGKKYKFELVTVEKVELKPPVTLTEDQEERLIETIYSLLMSTPIYDTDGEKIEPGMGEMGEARDAAQEVVNEWKYKNNITVIEK